MTGFEPATTRPPDAYSNRAELHPALFALQRYVFFANKQNMWSKYFVSYKDSDAELLLRFLSESFLVLLPRFPMFAESIPCLVKKKDFSFERR